MAIGSKRSWPTLPAAAAVVSALIVAPRKTPCSQSNASRTSGTTVARRPPDRNPSIRTTSAEQERVDRHAVRILPLGRDRRALGRRRREARVRLGGERVLRRVPVL